MSDKTKCVTKFKFARIMSEITQDPKQHDEYTKIKRESFIDYLKLFESEFEKNESKILKNISKYLDCCMFVVCLDCCVCLPKLS